MRVLSEFLDRFADVVEESDGYVVPCPAHADGHPSLRVALQGDALMLHCRAGCSKPKVLEALGWELRDLFGWELGSAHVRAEAPVALEESALAGLEELVVRCEGAWEPRAESDAVWDYAKERFGIDGDVGRELRLGFAPQGFSGSWVPRPFAAAPRLVVPFLDWEGRPRGLQARAVGEARVRWCGLANPGGASWSKMAVMRQPSVETWLVTEGPSDALTAFGAGFSAVGIRGASLGANEELADDLAAHLGTQKVVVVGDRDDAGTAFTEGLGAALSDRGVQAHVLRLPEPHTDLNEWRLADPAGFADGLRAAVSAAGRAVVAHVEPAPGPGADSAYRGEARSDVRVALDVLESEGGLRFNGGVGWLHWNGFSWDVDGSKDSPATRAAVHRQGQRYAAEAVGAPEERAKWLEGLAAKAQSSRSVDAILKEMAALPGVPVEAEQLDAREHLLAVRNGTVNLKVGELESPDPDDMLTASLRVRFDPSAECPGWLAFLEEAGDGKDGFAEFLQRLVGYGITGSNAEQLFVVHLGRGANGKSVFMDVLGDVFAAVTRVTGFGTFEEQKAGAATPELAALRGARMVMASEGAANRRLDEAMVKRITGGELVEVRQLYREPTVYRPRFLIQLATNHRPGIQGGDEGIWRRVRLVPWTMQVPKERQDKGLSERLVADEAEGILAWAVEGARRWYEGGLGEPEFLLAASERFRETSDELGGFLPGKVFWDPRGRVAQAKAYGLYVDWCDEEGNARPWRPKSFYNALEERGVDREVDSGKRRWLVGISLKEPDRPDPSASTASKEEENGNFSDEVPLGRFPNPGAKDAVDALGSPGSSTGAVDADDFLEAF